MDGRLQPRKTGRRSAPRRTGSRFRYAPSAASAADLCCEAGFYRQIFTLPAAAGQTTSQWLEESKPGSNYYFRVRTVLDDKGKVVSTHYGKIYGRFEFGRYKKAESLYLKSGIYYFNPTANDRNVEFDRSKNLATDVTASKKVTVP